MNRQIAGEQYYFPKVKEVVKDSLASIGKGRVILIVGQPGSGKSVFMSQLYDEYKGKADFLIGIRADYLNKSDSPELVFKKFDEVRASDKPKILLLDTLDVLAYSRRKELQEWLYYVDKLKMIEGMTVICASRSFEAEHLYPMNEQEWSKKILIDPLPDDFINRVLSKSGYSPNLISSEFRNFLSTPLHLKIAVDIVQKGGNLKDICTLQGIYSKLFEVLKITQQELIWLSELAFLMIKNRSTQLSYPLYSITLIDNIKKIERPGITDIIQIDDKNQTLAFSHQTLIDYFSAWRVTSGEKSIVEFVLENDQSLFIRPVIRHILGFLRLSSEKRLFKELKKIFFGSGRDGKTGYIKPSVSIRMHIKTAILTNMASWDNPTHKEAVFLTKIFKTSKEKDTFIVQFFNSRPNPDWYDVMKDVYVLPAVKIDDDSNIEYRIALSFISNIARHRPAEVLEIISDLLDQKINRTLEGFFYTVSEELSRIELLNSLRVKYVDFLELLVRTDIIKWPYEARLYCIRIAKYFPERGLKLFFDTIAKELANKDTKIGSPEGSLTDSFSEVLEAIFGKIPFCVLVNCTDFFEKTFSSSYLDKKRLRDSPLDLLYSENEFGSGLRAFYNWYKSKILEFCSELNQESKILIDNLDSSRWETQRQLSMLCRLLNVTYYEEKILAFLMEILKSDLQDEAVRIKSEIFTRSISKCFGVLSFVERGEIIRKIIDMDFDDKRLAFIWIWGPLNNIPEKFRDETITRKIKYTQEKFGFKEYKYTPPIKVIGFQRVLSPIPAEELKKMDKDELYKFLVNNRDLKERSDFDQNRIYGGVEELAQEIAGVFIEDLAYYREIIEKLSKNPLNDIFLEWVFSQIAQKGIKEEDFNWIVDVICTVYQRDNLQLELVRALTKIANNLSFEQYIKLKNTLLYLSNAQDPERDKFIEYRKQGYANDAISEGINSTRGALAELCVILLTKFYKESKEETLVKILENLSTDKTISVRASLVSYLPYALKPLGWDRCLGLFTNAFDDNAEEYADLVSQFLRYCPKEKFDSLGDILSKIKDRRAGKLGEAYAVLITIFYLRGLYSEQKIIELFTDRDLIDKGKEESLRLLANQVRYEENVDKCLRVIDKLLDIKDELGFELSILFMEARPEDLVKIADIIKKISKKTKLRGRVLYYILEYLEKSILIDPLMVFDLLENIISEESDDFYSLRDYIPASHSKSPLNIINTIFECYPEEEDRALAALDRLIKLKWSGVDEYLYALDRI